MKKKEWLEKLSLADDKYVSEADPLRSNADAIAKKTRTKKKLISIAACIVVMAMVGALFVPYDSGVISLRKYRGSEYYPLIEKLSAYKRQTNSEKNLFDTITATTGNLLNRTVKDAMDMDVEGIVYESMPEQTPEYAETTDNQVAGVIEADLIKRSDKYFYYLSGNELRVYPITGKAELPVGVYDLSSVFGNIYSDAEMYLSRDCNTVILVSDCYDKTWRSMIKVVSLDVSDPTNITNTGCFSIEGSYVSSRLTDGRLLLVSQYGISWREMDFSDEKTFVPVVNRDGVDETIPADCIFFPDEIDFVRYTVINVLGEKELENEGCMAFLSYSDSIYVSTEDIYVTGNRYEAKENGNSTEYCPLTDITRVSYKNKFENKGMVTVYGYIKDQYSLDAYNGMLRVVTTTDSWTQYRGSGIYAADGIGRSNANLYCIDIESLEIVASVIGFAPDGETVRSVRFDGTDAYVCTSVERRDPVFFFDLSDLDNITIKDTGTIAGFSESLINFKDKTLLGIGTGENRGSLKVEIYEETAYGVRSVCAYEKQNAEYPSEYKAFFIDRQNGLVGMGCGFDSPIDRSYRLEYILLQYDGYKLFELASIGICGDINDVRGVYVDGNFYVFDDSIEMQVISPLYPN